MINEYFIRTHKLLFNYFSARFGQVILKKYAMIYYWNIVILNRAMGHCQNIKKRCLIILPLIPIIGISFNKTIKTWNFIQLIILILECKIIADAGSFNMLLHDLKLFNNFYIKKFKQYNSRNYINLKYVWELWSMVAF